MNTAKHMIVMGIALAWGLGSVANAATQNEKDSAYQWGRWAILSPAAGGEPYVAALSPDAANNTRPGEADEFQPDVLLADSPVITPPVVVPNPPGNPPPVGDPREIPPPVVPPVVVPNPPGNPPPVGDPRGTPPVVIGPPVVVPNPPGASPPVGDPRGLL